MGTGKEEALWCLGRLLLRQQKVRLPYRRSVPSAVTGVTKPCDMKTKLGLRKLAWGHPLG